MAIVGSCIGGIGSAGQLLSFAAVNELVSKKQRGIVYGLFNCSSAFGSVFGGPMAYAMIAHASVSLLIP